MKRFFVLFTGLIWISAQSVAQDKIAQNTSEPEKETQGIQFWKGSFEDAKSYANEHNLLIFMDAYAVWCGPCKLMEKSVFTTDRAGEFFSEENGWLPVKMDMEKGDGVALSEKYQVRAYPTLFIIDGKGEVVHKTLGYMDVDRLISFGEEGRKMINEK